jgi:sugar phosphate isomerase/epimerase
MNSAKMKLGILSVSTPEWAVEEAIPAYAAAGLQGVGWRTTDDKGDRSKPSFWNGNRTSQTPEEIVARATELKKLCSASGLEMPSLGTYVHALEPEKIDRALKAATAIGATSIRVNPVSYPRPGKRYAELLAESRDQFRELAALGRNCGIRILIETHHTQLAPSASKAMQILDGLSPEDVGIIWDPCNQVQEGLETYRMAIDIAGPYLAEVHVKNLYYEKAADGRWKPRYCPIDAGIVHWPDALAELDRAGYTGWLMLEDFSTDAPVQERLTHSAAYLRSLLNTLPQ